MRNDESEIADFLKLCKIAPNLKLFEQDVVSQKNSQSLQIQIGNDIMQLLNINFVNNNNNINSTTNTKTITPTNTTTTSPTPLSIHNHNSPTYPS